MSASVMCGISSGKAILFILLQISELCFDSAGINTGYICEWILILITNVQVGIHWVRSRHNCRGLRGQKCFCSCLHRLCLLTSVIWRKCRHVNFMQFMRLSKRAMMSFPFCAQRCSLVVRAVIMIPL